jgi:alcohol dehydrogenase class IV
MHQYQPFSPVDIRFSTLRAFSEQLSSFSDGRVLILASEGTIKRLSACEGFVRLIEQNENRLISDIKPNPSVDEILLNINMLRREQGYKTILAVGGGSCIDHAKAISALMGLPDSHDLEYEDILDAIVHKTFFKGAEPAQIIAVPTTAGTGSEVTKWATVWDFKNRKKLSVEHIGCFPKYAVMIPELTRSMPRRLTLATGLDALSHAMEGFWAKARNPLSQALALDSIGRIRRALPAALIAPDDTEAREEMCMGSLLAGLAFSMTRTTACHSISYPITLNFNVDHGFAAALTLRAMMGINLDAVPELKRVLSLFGGQEGFDAWMTGVTNGIQELRLSAFGIGEEMVDGIVEGAFTLGRMDNNPVVLERETVKAILTGIL